MFIANEFKSQFVKIEFESIIQIFSLCRIKITLIFRFEMFFIRLSSMKLFGKFHFKARKFDTFH